MASTALLLLYRQQCCRAADRMRTHPSSVPSTGLVIEGRVSSSVPSAHDLPRRRRVSHRRRGLDGTGHSASRSRRDGMTTRSRRDGALGLKISTARGFGSGYGGRFWGSCRGDALLSNRDRRNKVLQVTVLVSRGRTGSRWFCSTSYFS